MVCAECALLPCWCRMLCHKHASKHKLSVACWLPPNQYSMLPLIASAADMWAGWCVKKVRAAAGCACCIPMSAAPFSIAQGPSALPISQLVPNSNTCFACLPPCSPNGTTCVGERLHRLLIHNLLRLFTPPDLRPPGPGREDGAALHLALQGIQPLRQPAQGVQGE